MPEPPAGFMVGVAGHRPFSSFNDIDAWAASRKIDRAEQYHRSERGFNESMRVASDRPSRVELWEPGAYVGFQRTTYGAKDSDTAYRIRVEATRPLKYRKRGYESHYFDKGSTFVVRKPTVPPWQAPRPITVNEARGTGSLAAMIFGSTAI